MMGVAFITAAIVVVLSVFNGLEELLHSLNNTFDPEIKIEAVSGKTFQCTDSLLQKVKEVKGVALVIEVLEDYAYVRYRDANQVVTLKGVSEDFLQEHRIDKAIVAGEIKLSHQGVDYAIIGRGIEYNLSVAVDDPMFPLQLYYIKNVKSPSIDPSRLYAKQNVVPGSVFSIVQNLDENYIVVPLRVVQSLMDAGQKRTSLEIKSESTSSPKEIQRNLQRVLGSDFSVLTQEEQHKDLYRLVKMEKLFTFLAFVVLLAIGSINIFFSLMMLALDKKKDISVLMAMGADRKLIRGIFISEGALISLLGTTAGLLLGGLLCWIQMEYGLVSMGMESSITEGYPIKPMLDDFLLTLGVVGIITFFISFRPAQLAARSAAVEHL
jgi:lipoprotein-releasing system permease protein